MLQLHSDPNFHYEAIRVLAVTRFFGADVAEILDILPKIQPGNFDDWYKEWKGLAERVLSTVNLNEVDSYSPVTLRNVYLRVSRYYFVADFFLHGNRADPRSQEAFELWRKYFDIANNYLSIPGQHVTIRSGHGFDIPALFYKAPDASASNPRPTMIIGGGFDSNYEETLHVFGFPALERGYNVVLYEGPGQPTLIHKENKGFIYDWEKTLTPVVDYIFQHNKGDLSYIDSSKIGLIGYSLGGYLAARAAAFEPRLAALVCIDGVWSFGDCCLNAIPQAKHAFEAGDVEEFNKIFDDISTTSSTNERWFHDHLKFSLCNDNPYDIFKELEKMTLEGIADRIKMPAFIGDAKEDIFFLGQPGKVVEGIGENADLIEFTDEQAAALHTSSGALVYLNQRIWEWFSNIVGR